MTKERVLEKLAKLIKHEESARSLGSMEEAEAFAAKINRFLLEHKLTMSQVQLEKQDVEDPIGDERFNPADHGIKFSRKRVAWQERLGGILARANCCRILVVPGSNILYFVGRTSDRQVVMYLYGMLAQMIDKESNRAYWKEYNRAWYDGTTDELRGFKAAWVDGAIVSLGSRFKEQRQEVVNTDAKQALIRVSDQAVSTYMNRFTGKAGRVTGQTSYNQNGYRQGKEWGSNVSVSKGVTAGGKQKSIKGGK
jgi:hypothetical protein